MDRRGTIRGFLVSQGFVSSTADTCVYSLHDGEVLRLLYVDDIFISVSKETKVHEVMTDFKNRSQVVDPGEA